MALQNGICVIGLLFALLGPVRAFAEMTVFVSPAGDGSYILEGDNAQGVEAIDLMIGYDTASLANPTVEAQGGAVTDVYTGTPGILNVAVARENPDTTFELHLKFDKKGNSPGAIQYVSATARGKEGKSYVASSDLRALSTPPANPANGSGSDSSATSSAVKLINSDGRAKSVLQRFREFRGEKGQQAFAALFKRNDGERIVQEPAIALSDGKTPVVLKLETPGEGKHSPDIALSDARLLSAQKLGEKSWVITVVPNEGACEARLVLGGGKEMIDFPLVVAPAIKIEGGAGETDFLVALDKYLSVQADARTGENETYRNEYIFTANYLAHLAVLPSGKKPNDPR